MDDLLGTIVAAVGVFAGTNVDDLLVLTVLFLSARAAGRPRLWQIWAGQYTGIGALVAISVVAALGLTLVPDRWVGLLGLVPFALGVKGLVAALRARGDHEPPQPAVATGLFSVAGVTIANGADNILAGLTPEGHPGRAAVRALDRPGRVHAHRRGHRHRVWPDQPIVWIMTRERS